MAGNLGAAPSSFFARRRRLDDSIQLPPLRHAHAGGRRGGWAAGEVSGLRDDCDDPEGPGRRDPAAGASTGSRSAAAGRERNVAAIGDARADRRDAATRAAVARRAAGRWFAAASIARRCGRPA